MAIRSLGVIGGVGAAIVAIAVMAAFAADTGSAPAASAASSQSAASPTEKEFLTVVKAHCLRCHPNYGSADAMVKAKWLKPGDPAGSPLYTRLKASAKGGPHDVTAAELTVVHDFIAASSAAASQPASKPAK